MKVASLACLRQTATMLILAIALQEDSTLVNASNWLAGLATGSPATGIAVIAIAAIGFGMLSGRIDLRRGASAVLGCFILFGAPAIVAAFSDLARSEASEKPGVTYAQTQNVEPPPRMPPQQDPYAGASLIR